MGGVRGRIPQWTARRLRALDARCGSSRLRSRGIPPHAVGLSVPEYSAKASEETPATSLRRAITLAVVLVCGVAFSSAVALVVRRQERERFENDFERQAQIEWRAMQVAVRDYEECLHTLRDLFDSSDEVNAGEFRRTSADLRARHPGLEMLAWLPRVGQERRAAFEEAASREDGTRFFIHEGGDVDAIEPPTPSPERVEYLPVQFCEPIKGNDAQFGFDHLHGPYQATIVRSIETGEMSATQRVSIGPGSDSEPGWAFGLPVFVGEGVPQNAGERRSRLRGILAGVVPFSRLLANTIQELPQSNEIGRASCRERV